MLQIPDDELPPGEFPVKARAMTDTLCLNFSWPVGVLTLLLFASVVYFGHDFSFIHAPDKNGFRCGLNNQLFHPNFPDLRDHRLLTADRECAIHCNGTEFMSYCIPKSARDLKTASFSFKIAYDASRYWAFALAAIVISIVVAFPFYLICAKVSVIATYASAIIVLCMAVTAVGVLIWRHNFFSVAAVSLLTILYLAFVYFLKRKIHVLSPLIANSLNLLSSSNASVLSAFFILIAGLIGFVFAMIGILFALGIGQPTVLGDDSQLRVVQHGSLHLTAFLFPFLGVWLTEFCVAWARTAISCVVASGYFNQVVPSFLEALGLMAYFHSGTLAFGSFAVLLLENLSVFFQLIGNSIKTTHSFFIKFLGKCMLACCFCLVQFIGEIHRLSFVFTAMKGVSFWDGCKEAATALKIDSILSIDILLHNVFLSVRIFLTLITAATTLIYVNNLELIMPWLPMAAIPAVVYIALSAIEVTMGASSETILICLCEDAKSEGIYAPKDLEAVLSWMIEAVGKQTFTA
jgi:hypothetical protein